MTVSWPLFGVHFGDDAAGLGRVIGGEAVDAMPKALFADGANPVNGDLGVLSRAADRASGGAGWW